ncbi:MAG: CHAP domain-containing protein [Bacteroidota bacterium]
MRVALAWAARHCRETVSNGGSCIDEVHRQFGRPAREAYCAKLVWVIAEEAARAAGIRNPVPKTPGACDMLQQAIKIGLRVDKTPGVGAIFYRSSKLTNSSGHVGLTIDMNDSTIRTVEGNNDDRIDDWSYPMSTVLHFPRHKTCQRGEGWDFIHIEDAGGAASVVSAGVSTAGPSFGSIALTIGALAGAYFTTKQLKH